MMSKLQSKIDLYHDDEIVKARRRIYDEHGYYIIKDFVSERKAHDIASRWGSGQFNYFFEGYTANKSVRTSSPNYLLNKPGTDDWSFCMHMWNPPIDEELHAICIEAQQLRNLIEGRSLFFGIQGHDSLLLQYRLSRTLSESTSVFPHADFLEEERKDPMGDHRFDPRRCQMTLMLSSYGKDYENGGFHLHDNQDECVLFGKDAPASGGDLIIWKYSNKHFVKGVQPIRDDIGFCRVIFPLFDREYLSDNT